MSNPKSRETGPEEGLLRLAAIEYIHALQEDMLVRDQSRKPQHSSSPFPRRHYVIEALANEIVPVQHHKIALVPTPGREPIEGISTVFFRMPTPYYDREVKGSVFESEYERIKSPRWNDVFIELLDEREHQLGKYLLNGAGLSRYEKTLTPDSAETDIVRNYVDSETTGDFFIARGGTYTPEPISGFDIYILHQVLQNYSPVMLTNN